MEFEKELAKISEQIADIDKKLKEIDDRKKERENQTEIGLISIVEDSLKIELLFDRELFTQEHLDKLKDIANELQDLLIDVFKDVVKEDK